MPRPASHPLLRSIPRILLAAGMMAVALPCVVAQAAPASDASVVRATQDTGTALVVLLGDPLATATKTRPPKGKKVDFSSSDVKAYRAQLAALRNDYKKWLRANVPQARVTGEFDIALNAVSVELNGATLEQVSATMMVAAAQYEGLYYPSQVDPDLALISAPGAWANNGGSAANAGAGVKVAILDTGIDITNPCFSDAGYSAQTQLGNHSFTNNKVIVAKVFSNRTPQQGFTAAPVQDHGTHVAGTVACNYDTPASVNGVAIPHGISGVAPRALLGNYNIFPGGLTNARSEDILNALEAAYQDGFDVANMSLGGGASGIQDLLTVAVDNLDRANMVVAVAAGNSGPGSFTVESPGSAERALTAGASSVGHMIATPISVGGGTYAGVTGDFATVGADLTAPLAAVVETPTNGVTGLSEACGTLSTNLVGKIALISRGTCSFSTKIRNAQNAGAVAVLVTNNQAGDGIGMAQDGTANQPTVPAYNVSKQDGAALKPNSGSATTIGATPAYLVTGNNDVMAGFSSQGPTDVDFRVKPDVVAPGVNVLSSIPAAYCATPPCFAFFQGTSMATPHLAGSAAVVRQQHPDWSAAQVRSAIVNTADQGVLKSYTTGALQNVVNINGTGRENLLSAVQASVALDPVSVSFGAVPSGSGQTRQMVLTITNVSGSTKAVDLAVSGAPAGVSFSVAPASLQLDAGMSASVTLTMSADRGAAVGPRQAMLTVSNAGAEVAHAALFTLVK
jgi:minor extracellular serine protease Vpr